MGVEVVGTFSTRVEPNWEAFVDCIHRRGTPDRVRYIELFLDPEMQEAVCERFDLTKDLQPDDPYFPHKRQIAIQRFLGYDYVRGSVGGVYMVFSTSVTDDTAHMQRSGGRSYVNESKGPITNWEEFEKYPWPDPANFSTDDLEWYTKNLPDDMCIVAFGGYAHYFEWLSWLMGYETLCYALYDQRDLVEAVVARITEINEVLSALILQFDRVKVMWGSDDMGYRSGTLIGPDDMRELILPGHKASAEAAHRAGKLYILHSCGNLAEIMDDLVNDVRIDGKHSFEDTIEDVTAAKDTYGREIALLGGIDVDFLCRASEEQVRRRVRDTLAKCMTGGGYCLGSGNTVANYVPIDNYLAMLDEGRKFSV